MPPDFKYDVAFSFVKDDEPLATQLNELLSGRLRTFLYSKQQEAIAGTNGEVTFNRVFGSEARTVVVLYRSSWGTTPWTRIEQTAIRNRAYGEGYDFALFIPLEKPPVVPQWLPKTRIWVGLDRWRAEGAASVIEARVQEAGGVPHEESLADRAAAIDRQRTLETDRKQFVSSQQGVDSARAEVTALVVDLRRKAEDISNNSATFQIAFEGSDDGLTCVFRASKFSLLVAWNQQWANVLDHASLYVRLVRGGLSLRGFAIMPPADLRQRDFLFTLETSNVPAWSERSTTNYYSSARLAVEIMNMLLKQLQNEK